MQMSSKFLTESTGEKIVKIGQYLVKIWTKYDSLVFLATLYVSVWMQNLISPKRALYKLTFIIIIIIIIII